MQIFNFTKYLVKFCKITKNTKSRMKFGLVIFNIHMTQPLSKKNFDFSREFLRQNKA